MDAERVCWNLYRQSSESRNLLWCFKVEQPPNRELDRKVSSDNSEEDEKQRFFRCAVCQHPITRPEDRICVNEQHQHVFANPHGYIFNIGCFTAAQGCLMAGDETRFFSWFPGYSWRYAHCEQCLTHLGWMFRSQEFQFVGLILDKLQV